MVLFLPVIGHFKLGQFTIVTIIIALLATRLVEKERFWEAGFIISLALAKPQLTILVLPGLAIAAYHSKSFKGAIVFLAGLSLGIGFFTLPLWVAYPNWLGDFRRVLNDNPRWLQPSFFSFFNVDTNLIMLLCWLGGATTLFLVSAWLWYKQTLQNALYWSMVFTTLIAPYLWSWDFTLLLPLLLQTAFQITSIQARLLLGIGFFCCAGIMGFIVLFLTKADHVYWWVPFVLCCLILGVRWLEKRFSTAKTYSLI